MAATFYSQILSTYAWGVIEDGLDGAIVEFRERAAAGLDPIDELEVTHGYATAVIDRESDGIEAQFYLGSVMNNTPSGKAYMPWSTNVTAAEAARDQAWWAALERAAARIGAYIESGEGDPTDIYICKHDQLDPVGQAMYEDATQNEGAR